MSRIESALKEVVDTSPANTFNNANPVLQAVMLHTDARQHLTSVICNDLSGDEMKALFECLIDIFADTLEGEVKEAYDLIRERLDDA